MTVFGATGVRGGGIEGWKHGDGILPPAPVLKNRWKNILLPYLCRTVVGDTEERARLHTCILHPHPYHYACSDSIRRGEAVRLLPFCCHSAGWNLPGLVSAVVSCNVKLVLMTLHGCRMKRGHLRRQAGYIQ